MDTRPALDSRDPGIGRDRWLLGPATRRLFARRTGVVELDPITVACCCAR